MATSAVVHLIDDDEGVRQSLAFLLATAGHAVRVYESAPAFLETVADHQPGCIISDVRMPVMDGLELQRRLRLLGVQSPMIIMTGHADVPLAVEAMKLGAVDFIEKPFDEERLLSAIAIALARQSKDERLEVEVAQIESRLKSLSGRERDVLAGVLAGHANKTIAFDLGLSPRTVEVHRANVMTKMAAMNLSELVRMAVAVQVMPTR